MLSHLRDRVREARLTPDTADLDRGAQLADYADGLDSLTRRMREFLVNFSDDRVRLNLITEELRQNVIELTMLPVASVFDAYPRAVRDLARTVGKEIEITIRGRETELDKKIIEQISEPLIHLVRNAVDHGIEAPAHRKRIGKPAAGHLILSAEQQGNRILITLKDDGCGIESATCWPSVIQRQVAAASDIDRWSPEQLLDLIFQPGFSTRASATDVSGRGVGMDVVKSVVERLGGTVRVQSEIDKGTSITLNMPLSLALLRVVLLEAGEELFALPTAAVRRIFQVEAGDIGLLQQGPVAEVDGENIPLTPLSTMLNVPASPPARADRICPGQRRAIGISWSVHEEQEVCAGAARDAAHQKTFTGAPCSATATLYRSSTLTRFSNSRRAGRQLALLRRCRAASRRASAAFSWLTIRWSPVSCRRTFCSPPDTSRRSRATAWRRSSTCIAKSGISSSPTSTCRG